MTFPSKVGKFFLFNKGSPTELNYCQCYRLLKKENLWPLIKHSNKITLYSLQKTNRTIQISAHLREKI